MLFTAEIKIEFQASAKKVWQWLTQPELVKQYFFGTDLVSNWEVGSPIFWRGEWEGQAYEDKGTILQLVPERILEYDYLSSWSDLEDKPENYQVISYRLDEQNGKTMLTITQQKIPTQEQRDHSIENWTSIMSGMKEQMGA